MRARRVYYGRTQGARKQLTNRTPTAQRVPDLHENIPSLRNFHSRRKALSQGGIDRRCGTSYIKISLAMEQEIAKRILVGWRNLPPPT